MMKSPILNARLHPLLMQLIEKDIKDGKFINKTQATNDIVASYYHIKELPPVEDLRRKGGRQ